MPSFFNKKILIGLLFFIAALIGSSIGTYLYYNPFKIISLKNPVFTLPLSPNHPALSAYALFYEFRGKIIQTENTSNGLKLITDIRGESIPEFIVSKNTLLVLKDISGKEFKTNKESLKDGSKVEIVVGYDLKRKTWKITKVAILTDQTLILPKLPLAPATSSAKKP